jgi:hypothetical protein
VAGRKQALADRWNEFLGARTGLWLGPVRPGLPQESVDDPRLLTYREAPAGAGVAVTALLHEGSLHTFALGPRSHHPWVVALRRSSGSSVPADVIRDVLARYYELVQPAGPADWLDVPSSACQRIAELPPTAAVLPWSLVMPEEALQAAATRARRERRGSGLPAGAFVGSPSFGPLSPVQLTAEAEKLANLARLLADMSLDPSRVDYDLGAVFLVDGERVRWFGNAGRHRIAVVAARGDLDLPMAVRALVRRDEADNWPQVAAGNITVAAALEVFDRVMEGRPPTIASRWCDWVDESESA